jgi:hypothetical protein
MRREWDDGIFPESKLGTVQLLRGVRASWHTFQDVVVFIARCGQRQEPKPDSLRQNSVFIPSIPLVHVGNMAVEWSARTALTCLLQSVDQS